MSNQWVDYIHPGILIPKLVRQYCEPESILDVGGGGGTVGGDWGGKKLICVLDIFPPRTAPPNFTCGDGVNAPEIYGEKSFDLVMACEVLEHLEFDRGPIFLEALEKVAKKMVILTTPHGFQEQSPEEHPEEPWQNNIYQKHLSGWCHKDLEKLGYTVYFNGGIDSQGQAAQLIAWKLIT